MTVMEIRKAPSKSNVNAIRSNQIIAFVGEVKDEIKKIHWTDREELKTYTKIVVAATFIFGMGIYLTDLMIQGVLTSLATIVHLLIGF